MPLTSVEIKHLQAEVSRRIEEHQPNPRKDAQTERMKATFDTTKMASYVNDGVTNIEKRCGLI
jgi:uncharacterized membrane protein